MQLIFNDIGGGEIILILVFVLIFFGAKSIPGLARTFGKTIRQIKEASSEVQAEIRKTSEDMKGDLNLKGLIQDTADDIKRPLDQYAADLDEAVKYQPPRRQAEPKPPGHPEREEKNPEDQPVKPEKSVEDKKESPKDSGAEETKV